MQTAAISYPPAIHESKEEGVLRKCCRHRPVQYLNNIHEQDHRATKKRIGAKQHSRRIRLRAEDDSSASADEADQKGSQNALKFRRAFEAPPSTSGGERL
jgi:transposase-like protein